MLNQPELKVIDTPQGTDEILRYLADKTITAFDTETTGVTRYDRVIGLSVCASPEVAYYAILAYWSPTTQSLVEIPGMFDAAKAIINVLKSKDIIAHNGLFDCSMSESFFKIRIIESLHTCTMTLAHLLDENRRMGLKELGSIYFGADATEEQKLMKASVAANGGSLTKDNYEMYKADSQLMAKYGAKDAWMTYMLFLELVPELYEQSLDKFFYEEESMPLLKGPTYDLNNTGLQVDLNALTTLKKTLQAECLEAKEFIHQEIKSHVQVLYPGTTKKNGFNIGASQQLSWLLFGQLGLEFGTLTKAGKEVCRELGLKLPYNPSAKRDFIHYCAASKGQVMPSGRKIRDPWAYIACDKKTLSKFASKYTWIDKLLGYQRKNKLLTTYVEGIESRVKYGIIQPSFLQSGTTSGRYASRSINFQNLPRDDQRIKDCIIARPGKVYVGADYSQLEPRVFSYLSGDSNLAIAFNGSNDFYSVIGMRVYSKTDCTPQKEGSAEAFGVKYKKLRNDSKVIALAAVYGATAYQLAQTTGKNSDDTQLDMDNYFEEFPGVANLMLDSHAMAKKQGYVENLFGRRRRMPEAMKIDKIYGKKEHREYPYEIRSILNLATNHRVQSTAASIVNRAAIKMYNDFKAANIDAKLILQVHDELVVECLEQDAESVSLILQNAMETAVLLPGIPLEAVPRVTRTLAK